MVWMFEGVSDEFCNEQEAEQQPKDKLKSRHRLFVSHQSCSLLLSLYFHIYDIFWSVSCRARLCWIFCWACTLRFQHFGNWYSCQRHISRCETDAKTKHNLIPSVSAATTSSHFNDLWLCCVPACRLFHTPSQSVSSSSARLWLVRPLHPINKKQTPWALFLS